MADTPVLRYILDFKIEKVAEGVVDSQGNNKNIPIESKLEGVYLVSSTNKKIFDETNAESYIKKSTNKENFFKENNLEVGKNYYVILNQTNIKKLCSIGEKSKLTLQEINNSETEFLYNIATPDSPAPATIQYTKPNVDNKLSIMGDYKAKVGDDGDIFEVNGESVIIQKEGGNPKGGRTKRRKYRKKRKSKSKSSRKSRRKTAKK